MRNIIIRYVGGTENTYVRERKRKRKRNTKEIPLMGEDTKDKEEEAVG